MKITVDECVFNKAILHGKLEIAHWLLEQGCPTDHYCYLQKMDLNTLNWLFDNGILIDNKCLSNVIQKTSDRGIIQWFCSKGAIVDSSCINSCISNNNISLLKWLIENNNIKLSSDNYKSAINLEDIDILDYLKYKECPYDETVVEFALKKSKKQALKWLVHNDFF